MTDKPATAARFTGLTLAASTLLAAVFVAVQAFYAREAYVDAASTRLLEKKLDICLANFESAAELDMALRLTASSEGLTEEWPPRVVLTSPAQMRKLQREVVPLLNALEVGLTKATILSPLDKHRAYLAQELRGLSKRLLDIVPARIGQNAMDEEINTVFAVLSEFLGAQYLVLTGCRSVAEGEV